MQRDLAVATADDLLCPMSLDVMSDPVTTEDGHTYDRTSITKWWRVCEEGNAPLTSPLTNLPVGPTLRPNDAIKKKVIAFLAAHKTEEGVMEPSRMLSSAIFEDLDRLRDMDLLKSLNLRPPKIIVIGSESHGKSTLLERLIGFPVLPRDKKLCTRMPIRVHLRRGPSEIASVCVRTRADGRISNPAVFVGALNQLVGVVKSTMDQFIAQHKREIIDDHEIDISIQVPYCSDLDILDLPGLVAAEADANNGASEKISDVTQALVRRVLTEEKDSAIFLLVVDIRVSANLSLGAKLVQECGVLDKTIGIFTKLDVLVSEDDESLSTVVSEILNGTARGSIKLQAQWLACSSRPITSSPTETKRLLDMENAEKKSLTEKFPELYGQGKLGMATVRAKVLECFEVFLVEAWVPHIQSHLVTYFSSLSDKIVDMGLPIPADKDYEGHIREIRKITPSVYPEYELSVLQTQNEVDFQRVLCQRVKAICQHESKDWLNVAQNEVFWDGLRDHDVLMAKLNKPTPPTFYLKGIADAKKEEEIIVQGLTKTAQALAAQLQGEVISRQFVKELVHVESEKVQSGQRSWGRDFLAALFQPLNATFSQKDSDAQAAITKLNRFPELMRQYEGYLAGCFEGARKEFTQDYERVIQSYVGCVEMRVQRDANGVKSTRILRASASGLSAAPHDILVLWLNVITPRMEMFAEKWVMPLVCLNESCRPDRLRALEDMVRVAEVLLALVELEKKVLATSVGKHIMKVRCPSGCGLSVYPSYLSKHSELECSERIFTCVVCGHSDKMSAVPPGPHRCVPAPTCLTCGVPHRFYNDFRSKMNEKRSFCEKCYRAKEAAMKSNPSNPFWVWERTTAPQPGCPGPKK